MKNYIILVTILFLFVGCGVFDKPETIPSYVEIDEFVLTTTSSQGTSDHKITDAWVFVDKEFVGVYELPARIPLIANGEHQVEIYPGIYKNGVQAERVIYPFYTFFDTTYNLIPDETLIISPEIGYVNDLNWWVEDFEDPSFKWILFPSGSDTTMFVAEPSEYPNLFEGNAGLIEMASTTVYCEMRTEEPMFNDLPRMFSDDAYMELNYKCNHQFILGLLHNNTGLSAYDKQTLITFYPTTDENGEAQWNKTYLYIPDVTNFFQQATEFDFFISILNNDGMEDVEVYVDNFKVLY